MFAFVFALASTDNVVHVLFVVQPFYFMVAVLLIVNFVLPDFSIAKDIVALVFLVEMVVHNFSMSLNLLLHCQI